MSSHNDDEDGGLEMQACPDCGHAVPAANMAIHQARGCGARKPAARMTTLPTQSNLASSTPESMTSDEPPATQEVVEIPETPPPAAAMASSPISVPDSSERKPAAKSSAKRRGSGVLQTGDFVDLTDHDDGRRDNDEDDSDTQSKNEDGWTCPQCTLINPKTRTRCEACNLACPEQERPADPVRQERLIDGAPFHNEENMYAMSSGALLGGLVGAAGAYMTGHPLSSAALEGAVTGAVGGAVWQEVTSGRSPLRRQNPAPSPPVTRTVRRVNRNGVSFTTTTYMSPARFGAGNDPMMEQAMLQVMLGSPHFGQRRNIDDMSYEQLLQAFGDGTENRGATESSIRSLPTATVLDVDTLPHDARQCMVCLEDFSAGESRKTLPCLHGFHQSCIDQWLRSNGNCPICKHRISE